MQGVINTTLLTQLLQLVSSARRLSLESTQVHALRKKDISAQSFPIQPLHDPDRDMAEWVTCSLLPHTPYPKSLGSAAKIRHLACLVLKELVGNVWLGAEGLRRVGSYWRDAGGDSTMASCPHMCHLKPFRAVNMHLRLSPGWSGAVDGVWRCSRCRAAAGWVFLGVFSGCAMFLLPNRRPTLFWRWPGCSCRSTSHLGYVQLPQA